MLYPKCPKCGGKSESAESEAFSEANHKVSHVLRHIAPPLAILNLGVMAGHEIYRRVPGGGQKRCTNPNCCHTFN